jgi:hypothetical protein
MRVKAVLLIILSFQVFAEAPPPICQEKKILFFAKSPYIATRNGKEVKDYYDRAILKQIHHDWPVIETGSLKLEGHINGLVVSISHEDKEQRLFIRKIDSGYEIVNFNFQEFITKNVAFGKIFYLNLKDSSGAFICQEKILYTKAEV